MPNRRLFLQAASAAGLLAFPFIGRAKSQPNVLIVTSDQEREGIDRSSLDLPNRERLESRGLRFTQAFCTTPQCSASRATLWTGLYPHEAGVVTNVDGGSLGFPLSPDLPNLGNVFARNGYRTGYLGKWHLGNDANGIEHFGFSGEHGGRQLRGERLAQTAANWIASQHEEPWLLVASFINPHDVYDTETAMTMPVRDGVTLPDNFHDTLLTKPSPQFEFLHNDQGKRTLGWGENEWLHYRSHYLHLIEKVDGHLGVILDALEKKGQLGNTIVVYTSDHGDMGGAHRTPFKGPEMYEELINVPLAISAPGYESHAGQTDSPASLVDLVPTLASLAGVSWPERVSGIDLSPMLEQPSRALRDEVFVEYYSKQHWVNPIRCIRTREWKYNRYTGGGEELYNLRNDPGERKNLAVTSFHEDVKCELAGRLQQWQKDTHDPLA